MTPRSPRPAYLASAHVDAVAARAPNNVPTTGDMGTTHHDVPVLAVAQSHLEGNTWSGGVVVLEATTTARLCELQLDTGVSSVAWCSGGSRGDVLVLGCDDGDVHVARVSMDEAWAVVPLGTSHSRDARNAGNQARSTRYGHDDVVTDVSCSNLVKTQMATCSYDLTVKLWEIEAMDKSVTTFEGHTDLVWGVAMHPAHAHVLCSSSQDSTVHVWDARQAPSAALVVHTLGQALSVDWHPNHSTVFSVGSEDGTVAAFDVRAPHAPLTQRKIHGAAVHVLKYSPYHEDLLASGGDDGQACVTTTSFTVDPTSTNSGVRELRREDKKQAAHQDYVRALDWFQLPSSRSHEDETLLATGSWDQCVQQWRATEYTLDAPDITV
ncbi:hypothetical protein PsorP6_013153 [Peronosclerospora sorghi]|uniref:Uncharacterized protein n=1 Tax=Peronosclerospora sorghi TaxID=230839 RepID=A0ACC0WJE4_9STRA|nr:hypothetical protein PsorP6_013153 [Peronosclerospora sorghi]